MRFHNNQVWRSEESHFQLLKLNLALKLDSYTYPKNSSTPNTPYWRLLWMFSHTKWFFSGCFWSNCDSWEIIVYWPVSSANRRVHVGCCFLFLGPICNVTSVWKSQIKTLSHSALCYMWSPPLSTYQPLQSHFPQGRWHLNSCPVIQGCSEGKKRICLCIRVSVYVNVNICVHTERLQEGVQNHREKDCNAFGNTKITFQLIVFQSFFLWHQFSPLNVYLHTRKQYSSPCIYVNVYSTTVHMIAFADISITFPISNCCQLWKVICSSVPTFLGSACLFFTHIGICTNKTIYTKSLTMVCM